VRPISVTEPATVAATSNSLFVMVFTICGLGVNIDGSHLGSFRFRVATLLKVKLLESMETHFVSQFMVTLMLVSETICVKFTGSSFPVVVVVVAAAAAAEEELVSKRRLGDSCGGAF